jgi:hypothetical protein
MRMESEVLIERSGAKGRQVIATQTIEVLNVVCSGQCVVLEAVGFLRAINLCICWLCGQLDLAKRRL